RLNDEVRYVADLLHLSHFNIQALQNACGKEIVQLIAFGSERERSKSGLMKDILKNCVATSWNPLFCDIIPARSDKSVGIDRMIEYFGIPLSETMAFGDGDNDIGMLRHVAIGIAMGNAEDNVKQAADYVTTPAIENGVVNALQHFKLL
ncbi:MAG: HAD hydrolase family protein, partial [Muribaculaceae bacterium]|nr:HAD hydrolase family protein [Muribaculaceae bacterium]